VISQVIGIRLDEIEENGILIEGFKEAILSYLRRSYPCINYRKTLEIRRNEGRIFIDDTCLPSIKLKPKNLFYPTDKRFIRERFVVCFEAIAEFLRLTGRNPVKVILSRDATDLFMEDRINNLTTVILSVYDGGDSYGEI